MLKYSFDMFRASEITSNIFSPKTVAGSLTTNWIDLTVSIGHRPKDFTFQVGAGGLTAGARDRIQRDQLPR